VRNAQGELHSYSSESVAQKAYAQVEQEEKEQQTGQYAVRNAQGELVYYSSASAAQEAVAQFEEEEKPQQNAQENVVTTIPTSPGGKYAVYNPDGQLQYYSQKSEAQEAALQFQMEEEEKNHPGEYVVRNANGQYAYYSSITAAENAEHEELYYQSTAEEEIAIMHEEEFEAVQTNPAYVSEEELGDYANNTMVMGTDVNSAASLVNQHGLPFGLGNSLKTMPTSSTSNSS